MAPCPHLHILMPALLCWAAWAARGTRPWQCGAHPADGRHQACDVACDLCRGCWLTVAIVFRNYTSMKQVDEQMLNFQNKNSSRLVRRMTNIMKTAVYDILSLGAKNVRHLHWQQHSTWHFLEQSSQTVAVHQRTGTKAAESSQEPWGLPCPSPPRRRPEAAPVTAERQNDTRQAFPASGSEWTQVSSVSPGPSEQWIAAAPPGLRGLARSREAHLGAGSCWLKCPWRLAEWEKAASSAPAPPSRTWNWAQRWLPVVLTETVR